MNLAGSVSLVNHDWDLKPFFDQEIEFRDYRGIWTPIPPIRNQTPFLLGFEDFRNSASLKSMI